MNHHEEVKAPALDRVRSAAEGIGNLGGATWSGERDLGIDGPHPVVKIPIYGYFWGSNSWHPMLDQGLWMVWG